MHACMNDRVEKERLLQIGSWLYACCCGVVVALLLRARQPSHHTLLMAGSIDHPPTHLSKHPQIGLLTSEASSIRSYLLQLHYVIMRVSNPLTYIIQFFLKPRAGVYVFRRFKRRSHSTSRLLCSVLLWSMRGDDDASTHDEEHKGAIKLYIPREMFMLPVATTLTGFTLGFLRSTRFASLRYLAEHAHKPPRSVQGWYFYHKTK